MVCHTKVVVFLLLLAWATTEFAGRANAQDDCQRWVKFGSRSYKYFGMKVDWATAQQYCLNLGANLVSIHSEAEYQHVKSVIRAQDRSENESWIGFSCCQKGKTWFWSDGTKPTFTKWNPQEPNYMPRECCAHMNFGSTKDWNDIPCDYNYAFVCVKSAE